LCIPGREERGGVLSNIFSSMLFKIYTVNYANAERKARMLARFEALNVPYHFHHPNAPDQDARIPASASPGEARNTSITWNHLDAIRYFLEDDEDRPEFGIFTEDDIRIRRDFARLAPVLTALYRAHELDVFLLGYLETQPVVRPAESLDPSRHPPASLPDLAVRGYTDGQWGVQMYMIDRRHGRAMLEHFTIDHALGSHEGRNPPFSPDWTLSKFGRRALVAPMMAVEEGVIASDHPAHVSFHRMCAEANYDPAIHV
jgi:hypothetical protein